MRWFPLYPAILGALTGTAPFAVALTLVLGTSVSPAVPRFPGGGRSEPASAPARDSALRALEFLIGRWGVPPAEAAAHQAGALANVIILDMQWAVGGHSIRLREHVPVGQADSAELEGLVYWDPAQERIEFVAVAGWGDDQGRLFVGEYRPQANGTVERTYDVYYRTLADTPGEEAGGSRRRYREVWEPAGTDRLQHTLEWWWSGRWQPYARGRYTLVRRP